MCSLTWRAWDSRCRARSMSSVASHASRYAASGTLASTITFLPPGRRTFMRPQPAVVRGGGHLLVEVAVRQHPSELDDALQLDLAPATAHVRRPQRRDKRRGALAQLRELLAQRSLRPLAASSSVCTWPRPSPATPSAADVPCQLRLGDLEEGRAVGLVRIGSAERTAFMTFSSKERRFHVEFRWSPPVRPGVRQPALRLGAEPRRAILDVKAPSVRPRTRAEENHGRRTEERGRTDNRQVRSSADGQEDRAPNWPKRPQAPQQRSTSSPDVIPRRSGGCSTSSPRPAWSRSRSSSGSPSSPGRGRGRRRSGRDHAGRRLQLKSRAGGGGRSQREARRDVELEVEHRPADERPALSDPAVYGEYDTPLKTAQFVHNLEHGPSSSSTARRCRRRPCSSCATSTPRIRAGCCWRPIPSSRTRSRSAPGPSRRLRAGRQERQGVPRHLRELRRGRVLELPRRAAFQGPERFPPDSLEPGSA